MRITPTLTFTLLLSALFLGLPSQALAKQWVHCHMKDPKNPADEPWFKTLGSRPAKWPGSCGLLGSITEQQQKLLDAGQVCQCKPLTRPFSRLRQAEFLGFQTVPGGFELHEN